MSKQEVILCESLETSLGRAIERCPHDKLFILTDEHTQRLCLPSLKEVSFLKDAVEICIGAEDVHKTLETLASVWMALSQQGATRHSLLINLGGGMVTDLGGFAAATFKRGISYINIPTTLLAMVDASVGGKTGINFNGLKNEIGSFAPADSVLIETEFLRSLDAQNFFSGYAEMLKHGLISNTAHWVELLDFNTNNIDYAYLKNMVGRSVQVKEDIVEQDPFERGIRKALNLGHTAGHAFESLALAENRPVLHGYAVHGESYASFTCHTSKSAFRKTRCDRPSNSSKRIMVHSHSTVSSTNNSTHLCNMIRKIPQERSILLY